MTERELNKTFINSGVFSFFEKFDDEEITGHFKDFARFMTMYNCAIKEIQTKFEVLNDDFSVTYRRNPIEMIKSRVKKPGSIVGKLKRKNLPLTMESVLDNINDVAGVRVICSFIDDIYMISEMLASQDDVEIIEVKDYIKNPKPNGYRSYHMIVEIPVFFSNMRMNMRVEVQLRTIAMDFWASLEHKMKYKKNIEGAEKIIEELTNCAEIIAAADEKMQRINNELEKMSE